MRVSKIEFITFHCCNNRNSSVHSNVSRKTELSASNHSKHHKPTCITQEIITGIILFLNKYKNEKNIFINQFLTILIKNFLINDFIPSS